MSPLQRFIAATALTIGSAGHVVADTTAVVELVGEDIPAGLAKRAFGPFLAQLAKPPHAVEITEESIQTKRGEATMRVSKILVASDANQARFQRVNETQETLNGKPATDVPPQDESDVPAPPKVIGAIVLLNGDVLSLQRFEDGIVRSPVSRRVARLAGEYVDYRRAPISSAFSLQYTDTTVEQAVEYFSMLPLDRVRQYDDGSLELDWLHTDVVGVRHTIRFGGDSAMLPVEFSMQRDAGIDQDGQVVRLEPFSRTVTRWKLAADRSAPNANIDAIRMEYKSIGRQARYLTINYSYLYRYGRIPKNAFEPESMLKVLSVHDLIGDN